MSFTYQDDELVYSLNALSKKQRQILSKTLNPGIISQTLENIKRAVADEAKQRIQSKIALTFIRGYSQGELFNSIYTTIEGGTITVKSTKSYFAILNAGIRSYDMKESLGGKTVKMRLPGGKVIYRKVPTIETFSSKSRKNKRIPKTGGWIYPGFSGVHIYETVAKEMELWTRTYIRSQVQDLFRAAGTVNSEMSITNSQPRGQDGRFIKKTSNFSTLFKDDLSSFSYSTLNGVITPNRKRK